MRPKTKTATMADSVADLAAAIRPNTPQDPSAKVRIGVVTEVEAPPPWRVRLDITGAVWLATDADARFIVGDRVYAVQQGSMAVVAGRIVGASAAPPVGSVTMFAGASTAFPAGWLHCNGQLLDRAAYPALFAAIGTTYGSTLATNFRVPDLSDRVPVGAGSRARGTTGGAATVTLTTGQLPAHTHGQAGAHTHSVSTAESPVVSNNGADANPDIFRIPDGTHSTSSEGNHTHASVGSGEAHENMPPFIVLHYIIRAV